MHELAISQEVVRVACEHAAGSRVTRIVLCIGKLSAVLPDAVRFCFDVCAAGTAAQGAVLEINEPMGLARCRRCGDEVELEQPFGECSCGSTDLDWIRGEELQIESVEIA